MKRTEAVAELTGNHRLIRGVRQQFISRIDLHEEEDHRAMMVTAAAHLRGALEALEPAVAEFEKLRANGSILND